jgi:hypothetical protein
MSSSLFLEEANARGLYSFQTLPSEVEFTVERSVINVATRPVLGKLKVAQVFLMLFVK